MSAQIIDYSSHSVAPKAAAPRPPALSSAPETQFRTAVQRLCDGETDGQQAIDEIAAATVALNDAGWFDQHR